MGELNGKVAIITGAGRLRSIGFETAMALARLGADIVVTGTGRDPESFPPDERKLGWRDVESTAERVRELGRKALPLVADVTRVADVDRMVARTLEELGRVDILINNAAMPIGRDRRRHGRVGPGGLPEGAGRQGPGHLPLRPGGDPVLDPAGRRGKDRERGLFGGQEGSRRSPGLLRRQFRPGRHDPSRWRRNWGPTGSTSTASAPPPWTRHAWTGSAAENSGRRWESRTPSDAPEPGRKWRHSSLSLCTGAASLDPRPVHQHRRRNGHGALRNHAAERVSANARQNAAT